MYSSKTSLHKEDAKGEIIFMADELLRLHQAFPTVGQSDFFRPI
jgi:hypothetical protein